MPRAIEILDATVRRIERGEMNALEAIDALLAEELTLRENRRVKMALAAGSSAHRPRRLRLLVPALARQEPHHGCIAELQLHRPRRGLASDRAARNRQKPLAPSWRGDERAKLKGAS